MSDELTRFNVLGVGVHALSLQDALARVLAARNGAKLGYACFCTAYGLVMARDDSSLRDIYNQAYLTAPDGMPLVWLGRWYRRREITRVYGPDLLLAACDLGREQGVRHYFYGGESGIAEALVRSLESRFPGLQVAGFSTPPHGPLTEMELEALRAELAESKADLLWIGLGAPKQEQFMARYSQSLSVGLMLGVGAAFDFHSGRVRQAPRWVQRCGLEWLFRLCIEPRRLGRRYLITTPRFAFAVLWQLWRERFSREGRRGGISHG